MKRFHVHLHVDDLARNIAFYSAMFSQEPSKSEADYAKWMLQDPPVNFAISTRGSASGVDHLGIQVENEEELSAMKARAQAADMALFAEGEANCCYARSNKYWVTDPQGLAWEQFRTLDSIPVYGEVGRATSDSSCCAPTGPASATANTTASARGCGNQPSQPGAKSACC